MDQDINNTSPQAPDFQISDDNQIFEVEPRGTSQISQTPQVPQVEVQISEPVLIVDKQPEVGQNLPENIVEKTDVVDETAKLEDSVDDSGDNFSEAEIINQDDLKEDAEGAKHKYKQRRHHESVFLIEVEKIKPNPFQPRKHFDEESLKELAASIREFGIIQPLVVSKIEHDVEDGTKVEYQLIAGERRLMAAKMLGMERVPAIVRRLSQKAEQMEVAIVENLQRANLNAIETARAYARLQDEFGLTQREIASRLGKSRESIANTLRILNLPTEIQEAVAHNKINESQARLLLAIDDMAQQMVIFHELVKNNLSVRELRQMIKKGGNEEETIVKEKKAVSADPEISHFQEQLTELLGAPVKIDPPVGDDKKGKIVISFYSPEEIEGIIQKLNSNLH